jgi:hypothetical protein
LLTDQHPDGDEYRREKAALMRELDDRFGTVLKVAIAPHGEKRFETRAATPQDTNLVRECLNRFMPWSTEGVCILYRGYKATDELPAMLSGRGRSSSEQDLIEVNRFHAIIHPLCYGYLTEGVGLDAPDSKLEIPRFFFSKVV